MSKKNYMGKIDKDYTGTTAPNYDNFDLIPPTSKKKKSKKKKNIK